jgi:hypothetical protein
VAPIEVPPKPLDNTAATTPQISLIQPRPTPPAPNFQLAGNHKEGLLITKSNFIDA